MTREECINNLKQSKGTPFKHQTVTKAISDLRKLDKIEQIIKDWSEKKTEVEEDWYYLSHIADIFEKE